MTVKRRRNTKRCCRCIPKIWRNRIKITFSLLALFWLCCLSGTFIYCLVILSPALVVAGQYQQFFYSNVPFMVAFTLFLFSGAISAFAIESVGPQYGVPAAGLFILAGSFLASAGFVLDQGALIIVGVCVFAGSGSAVVYIGSQRASQRWYWNIYKPVSVLVLSGFGFGPFMGIVVVRNSFSLWVDSPEVFVVGLALLLIISIVIALPALRGPKKAPVAFRELCVIQMPKDYPEHFPPLYLTWGALLKDPNVYMLFIATSCAFVVSGCIPAVLVKIYTVDRNSDTYGEFEPLYEYLQYFFGSTFVGRVAIFFGPKIVDYKVLLVISYVTQLIFGAIFAEYFLVVGKLGKSPKFAYPFVIIEGLLFGLVSGGVVAYLPVIYGGLLHQVLHGFSLSIATILVAISLSIFGIFVSYNSTTVFYGLMVGFSGLGLTLISLVSIHPYRLLLDQLRGFRKYNIICLFFGYEIEFSKWSCRLVRPRDLLASCANIIEERGASFVEEMRNSVPKSITEVSWIFWKTRTIMTCCFVGSLCVVLMLYAVPLLALIVDMQHDSRDGTSVCNQTLYTNHDKATKYIAFISTAIVVAYLAIIVEVLLLSRAIVDGIKKLHEKIQNPVTFVFGGRFSKPEPDEITTIIRELYVCDVSTNKLKLSVLNFARFVPTTIVKKALTDPKYRCPYGNRTLVTIMFFQLGKFADMINDLDDEELNKTFSFFCERVATISHKYSGVIAEILEEDILVFWNTPDPVENPNELACKCALELEEFVTDLSRRQKVDFKCSIGIHSGYVITGVIGVASKMKFGAIGDSMNFASRLKGLCKQYSCRILVSQSTLCSHVLESMIVREVNEVIVVGKSEPTRIYELVGKASSVSDSVRYRVECYEVALSLCRKGELSNAITILNDLRASRPGNLSYSRLHKILTLGLEEFGDHNPKWDGGVDKLNEK